jgi:hypothetical protein
MNFVADEYVAVVTRLSKGFGDARFAFSDWTSRRTGDVAV